MKNSIVAKYRHAIARRLLPKRFTRALQVHREARELAALERHPCEIATLRNISAANITDWLAADLAAEWQQVCLKMSAIRFGGGSGAVNPGDRRALYYVARALRSSSILEVGTHVGASTSMLALALRRLHASGSDVRSRLLTVDIVDVNDPVPGAWRRIGCSHSPADVMRTIGCQDLVTFVTSPSILFLRNCKERFDLIFLDGDHSASTVYQEVPAALQLLNPNGVILLHDYFPNLHPLWSDGAVVLGPELAIGRLRAENVPIVAKAFGGLPWATKLESTVSSLALLCRSE
jgi:predicted O-methyltransferase YrrM